MRRKVYWCLVFPHLTQQLYTDELVSECQLPKCRQLSKMSTPKMPVPKMLTLQHFNFKRAS